MDFFLDFERKFDRFSRYEISEMIAFFNQEGRNEDAGRIKAGFVAYKNSFTVRNLFK
jgi:hypothetical protein